MEANVAEHQERRFERIPSEKRVGLGLALAKDASSSTLNVHISRHGPGPCAASAESEDIDVLTKSEGLRSMNASKSVGPLERRKQKQKLVIGEGSTSGSGTIETGTCTLGRSQFGGVEMEIGESATNRRGEQLHVGVGVENAAFVQGESAVGEPVSNLVQLTGDESSRASAHVEAWLQDQGGEAGSLSGSEQPLESPCPALIADGSVVQEAEQTWSHEALPETETSNAAGVTLIGESEGLNVVPTDDLPALAESEEYFPSESDPEGEEPPELLPADEDEDSGSEFEMLSLPELIDDADFGSDATDDELPAVPGRIRPQQGPAQVAIGLFPVLRADSQRAGHVQGQDGRDDGAESEYDDVLELLSGSDLDSSDESSYGSPDPQSLIERAQVAEANLRTSAAALRSLYLGSYTPGRVGPPSDRGRAARRRERRRRARGQPPEAGAVVQLDLSHLLESFEGDLGAGGGLLLRGEDDTGAMPPLLNVEEDEDDDDGLPPLLNVDEDEDDGSESGEEYSDMPALLPDSASSSDVGSDDEENDGEHTPRLRTARPRGFLAGPGNRVVLFGGPMGAGGELHMADFPLHGIQLARNRFFAMGDFVSDDQLDQVLAGLGAHTNQLWPPPASREAVLALERVTVTTEATEESCSVCRNNLEVEIEVLRMPCSHLFHADCLHPWLNVRNSCPLCRFQLPTDDPDYEATRRHTAAN